jgi:hypothetical protein
MQPFLLLLLDRKSQPFLDNRDLGRQHILQMSNFLLRLAVTRGLPNAKLAFWDDFWNTRAFVMVAEPLIGSHGARRSPSRLGV